MAAYLIAYDLNKPGQNYEDLYEAIKNAGDYWWHYLDSTWIIISDSSAEEIFDKLDPHIDRTDHILVIEIKKHWYARLPQKGLDWLKEKLP